MNSWTPLWNRIVDSSIWTEPYQVRVLFLTMLALKDRDHVVRYDAFGLARRANMKESEVMEAMKVLMAPDKKRIEPQDFDGRRVEAREDGWLILNGEKYRKLVGLTLRERKAINQYHYRQKQAEKAAALVGGSGTLEERNFEECEGSETGHLWVKGERRENGLWNIKCSKCGFEDAEVWPVPKKRCMDHEWKTDHGTGVVYCTICGVSIWDRGGVGEALENGARQTIPPVKEVLHGTKPIDPPKQMAILHKREVPEVKKLEPVSPSVKSPTEKAVNKPDVSSNVNAKPVQNAVSSPIPSRACPHDWFYDSEDDRVCKLCAHTEAKRGSKWVDVTKRVEVSAPTAACDHQLDGDYCVKCGETVCPI